MPAELAVSEGLREILAEGVFDRLPPTFSTYFYDRVRDWERLFPAEREYFERLARLLQRSTAEAVEQTFAPLRAVEAKMGVNERTWPRDEFTLEHVDFLQRNPHLREWRQTIADIFARIDPLLDAEIARQGRPRLAIVLAPAEMPMGSDRLWTRLKERGKVVPLELAEDEAFDEFVPLLLTGAKREAANPSIMERFRVAHESSAYDIWSVETGDAIASNGADRDAWTDLSFEGLEAVRLELMDDVNSMLVAENIRGPRQLGQRLRSMEPEELSAAAKGDPVLASFLQSVLLNGNGTLLLNNTFVEWATVQAIRRARPVMTVVGFGIRNKMKPFSSLLIYSDQEETNPIPSQQDVLGSYVDLEVFYEYLYNEFEKYPQYRKNTAYIFAVPGVDALLAIGPPDFGLLRQDGAVDLRQVHEEAAAWLGV